MVKRITALFLTVAMIFAFSACRRTAERISDAEALPLQTAIDAVLAGDAQKYREVFPPDYDSEIDLIYSSIEAMPFDDYLAKMFNTARDGREDAYGKNSAIEFVITQKTEINIAQEIAYFADYNDANILYNVKIDAIDKAILVSGTLSVWGKNDQAEKQAEFVLFRQDGIWYLHPVYYFFTFTI